jgi:hypothetical protein
MQNIEVIFPMNDGRIRGFRLELRAPREMYGYYFNDGVWTEMGEMIADDMATLDDAENFLRSMNKRHAKYRRF